MEDGGQDNRRTEVDQGRNEIVHEPNTPQDFHLQKSTFSIYFSDEPGMFSHNPTFPPRLKKPRGTRSPAQIFYKKRE